MQMQGSLSSSVSAYSPHHHHRRHLSSSSSSSSSPSLSRRRHSLLLLPSRSSSSSFSPTTTVVSGFEIDIDKVGDKRNYRRIRSRIAIDADIDTVWQVLTDYEGLAAFIPSITVSSLLYRKDNFARIYQVGEQELALGLKFNAKGVLECYERDLEVIPGSGRKRDIDFKMVEGDFQTFEGRWSIQQIDNEMYKDRDFFLGQEFRTTLSYVVELEPKLWLPVRLLEGRLCKEVKTNLQCVREEAQRVQRVGNGVPFDLGGTEEIVSP